MKKELIKMKKVFLIISIFLLGGAFSFSNENNPATIIEHYESKTVIVQDKVKENNEISETKEYYSNGKIKKETKIVNGENVLTIPVSEGYGGIVIKTSFGKYGILSSETTMHNNEPTYQFRLSPLADSIYKRIDNRKC